MAKVKNYSGKDLPANWRSFARKEINRIKKILESKGCKDLEFYYGFYYFSGFFTTPSGQMYHIFSSDTRDSYKHLVFRTVRDYSDFTGGLNQRVAVEDLPNIPIK